MKAEFLWEVFTETGAPEAYLLYKDAGRAASAMSKREAAYVPNSYCGRSGPAPGSDSFWETYSP